MNQLYYMSKYIFIINFAKNNAILYFIILNFFILVIILSLILFIIAIIKFKNHNNIPLWLIYILQFIIPFISSYFFCQIFYTLLTTFVCEENSEKSFFSPSVKCFTGLWMNFQESLSIISIVILFIISYITNLIFYNPMCLRAINKKINSLTDEIFFFTKIVMNILFIFFRDINDNYPLLLICIFFSGINSYCLSSYQGYSNRNLFIINNILARILLWGFICLFIGKIFILIEYYGTSYLFVIGIILILMISYYKANQITDFFMIDKSKIDSNIEYYKYILKLQTLIENKNKSRQNKLMLKSFLTKQEENCVLSSCFLKKYLNCLSKNIDSDILLYYYMQELFEEGLNKFNNDLTLTISYIYFLVKRLSKKKKAIILFKSIKKDIYSIDKLFNIFRCKEILETLWTGFDGKDRENIESVDIIKIFEYKNNVNKFKELLTRISLLYYDFWLALFSNNCEGKEEFKTLNEIGGKINKLLNPIEQSFNLIYCIKNDDIEILKLYSGYIKNILNDEKKYEEYHHILSNASTNFVFETTEIDYTSFDINNLHKEKKEIEYFIISTSDKDINERKILNMSIGLSTIIGYQKEEIVGKDINILIPRIFHNAHNLMLKKLTNKIKMDLYQTLSNEYKYVPDIISKTVYLKTKNNFLKRLEFKSYLVQNEDGDHIYIVEIIRNSSFPTSWNEIGEEPPCCVLTDRNFIIQLFTADCCEALGFNSNVINSNFEITSCILQFNDDVTINYEESSIHKGGTSTYLFENSDFISNNNNNIGNHFSGKDKKSNIKNIMLDVTNNISRNNSSNKVNNIFKQMQNNNLNRIDDVKNKIKRKLVKTKYMNPQVITWKINDNYIHSLKNEGKSNFRIDKKYSYKTKENYNNKFQLSVKECRISKVVLGYYFFFKKIKLIRFKYINSKEEINYFKRYISNTAEDEQVNNKEKKDKDSLDVSSYRMKKINKSNTDKTNNKSGFYISQHILKRDTQEKKKQEFLYGTEINSKIDNLNFIEEENKDNSFFLISEINDENLGQNNQGKENLLNGQVVGNNGKNEQIIFSNLDSNYVPKNFKCFDFNLETMCYSISKAKFNLDEDGKSKDNSQISNLLNFYQKKMIDLHKNTLNDEESSSTKKLDEDTSNENESSESYYTSYNSSESFEEDENEKNVNINETEKRNKKTIINKKASVKEEKESLLNELMTTIKNGGVKNGLNKDSSNKVGKYPQNNFLNDYYKIKFDKIRFFYYNSIQEMVIEDIKYQKISQVENLINESRKLNYNFNHHISKNESSKELKNYFPFLTVKDSNIKENKFKRRNSTKKFDKIKLEELNEQNKNKNEKPNNEVNGKLNNNGKELENKIKEALNQEDKQRTIHIFLTISLVELSLLIIMGIIFNYYILSKIKNDIDNIHLICYSAQLRTLYNVAVYYLRELTLVNFLLPNNSMNEKYIQYPEYRNNSSEYIKSLRNKINNIYVETHLLTESLTSVEIPLSNNAIKILQENNLTIYVLTNDLNIYPVTSTFSISLIQMNSALNNLAIRDSFIQQNVTDVYIFIHNYLNDVGVEIKGQINIYIEELELRIKKKKKLLIIAMIIIFIIIIILFILLCISFNLIIKKKSSYIEGFYGIKLSYIKQSIRNCEHYIYFLKKQKKEEESGLKHDKNSQISQNIGEAGFEEEIKLYDSFPINKNVNNDFYNTQKRGISSQNNVNRDKSSMINFAFYIFIFFLIIYGYFILVCLTYVKFMNDSYRESIFIFHLQRLQNNIFELYNGYREYLFDENTIIYGYNSLDYLKIQLEEIFKTKGEDTYIANTEFSHIKKLKNDFIKFNHDSLCSRMEEGFFESEEKCENFLEGQIKYGYQIASFTFIDLIITGSNCIEFLYEEKNNIIGNLTEYGIKEYENVTNNQKFRLYFFNNGTIHSDINVLFAHALLPYFTDIINISSTAIINSSNDSYSVYLIYMITFISLNLLAFIFVWIPYINNMNSVIYNAKKILRIIPIHILSTLANIKKILNLEKNKSG